MASERFPLAFVIALQAGDPPPPQFVVPESMMSMPLEANCGQCPLAPGVAIPTIPSVDPAFAMNAGRLAKFPELGVPMKVDPAAPDVNVLADSFNCCAVTLPARVKPAITLPLL